MVSRHAREIEGIAYNWESTQRRFSNVSIPYIIQIRLNWLNYHEFRKIKCYELYGIHKIFMETFQKPITFFRVLCKPRCFIKQACKESQFNMTNL
jgi:hypothetical protein